MKKLSIAAGAAAIALVATTIFPVAGVFAKTSTYAGNDSVIDLKREVTDVTNPVTNTFSYTITQGEIPTGATVTGFPANAQIQFNNVTPTSGTATATTSLDFANTDYSKVGDYYFILKETDSTDPTNYPVDTASNDYKIIAQVRYVVDDQNIPDNNTFTTTLILLDANGDKVNTGIATWTSSSAYGR